MLALSENLIIAKNSLHTQYPWLLLAELAVNDDGGTYHRWVQNNEDLVLLLDTYGGSGVVAHYKLNDNAWSTAVLDSSGNGNHATAQRNTTNLHIAGAINSAHYFNGSSDYHDCGDPFESTFQGSFSISIWVKPDDGRPDAANEDIFGVKDGTDHAVLILTTLGNINYYYTAGGNNVQAQSNSAVFSDGPCTVWTHIVATVDGSNIKLYINGSEITLDAANDGDMTGVTMSEFTSAENIYIGARNDDGSDANHFAGGIDNAMLFGKALTAAEVTALYRDGAGTEKVPATFQSFNFDLDQITYKGAEMPRTTLRLSNVTQFIKSDLENNRGCTASEITIRVVHANQLYEDYSELDTVFEVIYPRITAKFVEFSIGGPSPLRRRFPLERYLADTCRYVSGFKTDPRCGYAGAATSCSGLRSRCRELGNETNFGGFPGLRPETMRLA